jgi:hypothetical protein
MVLPIRAALSAGLNQEVAQADNVAAHTKTSKKRTEGIITNSLTTVRFRSMPGRAA